MFVKRGENWAKGILLTLHTSPTWWSEIPFVPSCGEFEMRIDLNCIQKNPSFLFNNPHTCTHLIIVHSIAINTTKDNTSRDVDSSFNYWIPLNDLLRPLFLRRCFIINIIRLWEGCKGWCHPFINRNPTCILIGLLIGHLVFPLQHLEIGNLHKELAKS